MPQQYYVASSYSKDQLNQEVTNLLNEGWELEGNLCIAQADTENIAYAQALTKIE